MSKVILVAVVSGFLVGMLLIPKLDFGQAFLDVSGDLIIISICILLFFVGFEIGKDDTVIDRVRKVGFRIFLFPIAAILGTYVFAAIGSVFLPISAREAAAASGGFGWYSFAPNILMAHSVTLSAICFVHNVMRELLGIVLIPIVAQRIGYLESTTLPGVCVGDVCLPILERSASSDVTIYAVVMGLSMSLAVPLVGVIAGI